MPKSNSALDDVMGLEPTHRSERASATLQLRRQDPAASADGSLSSSGARRLRNFIDRLFETSLPRTADRPAGRKGRSRAVPAWGQQVRQRVSGEETGFAPPTQAAVAGGMLDWADSRVSAAVPKTPTPVVIARLFGVTVMLVLLAFGTSSITISQMRDTVRTIGLHAKPAIDAAERVRTALGAMDVDAGSDSLLGDAVSTGTSRDFAADASAQIAAMLQAGTDVADGDAAARLQAMQYELHLYYGVLGEARDAGRSKPWIAAQRVKFASRLLRSHVMAQADAFEAGNRRQLEDAYGRSQEQSLTLAACFIGVGSMLAITLVAAQIILLRRTRRLVNLPLAAATASSRARTARFAAISRTSFGDTPTRCGNRTATRSSAVASSFCGIVPGNPSVFGL